MAKFFFALLIAIALVFLLVQFFIPVAEADECCTNSICTLRGPENPGGNCFIDICSDDGVNEAICVDCGAACTIYDTCSDPTTCYCNTGDAPNCTGPDNDNDGFNDCVWVDINFLTHPTPGQNIRDKNISFIATFNGGEMCVSTYYDLDVNIQNITASGPLIGSTYFRSNSLPFSCRPLNSPTYASSPFGASEYCQYDENLLLDRTGDYNLVVRYRFVNGSGTFIKFGGQKDMSFTYTDDNSPVVSGVFVAKSASACTSSDYATSNTSVTGFSPGTNYFCVRANVSDFGGQNSINLSNSKILFWNNVTSSQSQANSSTGWDRYKITSFADCDTANSKTSMTVTDKNFCATLGINSGYGSSSTGIGVKDANGNYDINVIIQDYSSNGGNNYANNAANLNTTTGISLSSSACTFSANPDTNIAMNCSGTPQELITVTHTGNVEEKIYAYMSTVFSTPSYLRGNSIYWKASQISTPSTTDINSNATSITSNNCVSQPLNIWARGTQSTSTVSTQNLYWYMALPKLSPGAYTGGVVTISAYAQGSNCT